MQINIDEDDVGNNPWVEFMSGRSLDVGIGGITLHFAHEQTAEIFARAILTKLGYKLPPLSERRS